MKGDWSFNLETTDGQDPELELELYRDKSNVVVITLSASGLTWAAIVEGQTFSGKLTGLKCETRLSPPPNSGEVKS
jgi:hypothetical protein